ncbi:hypothetical protein HNR44_000438 [Geomicrobium halophilum]|uniref:Intracellular proteinase inhibitor n=1 Tax=Geomicrobium halophilum TaxID=549000 RepID=A0A841PIB6_9BACL|nr:hypothetical protein [Geomicrobium halophilum]MBB6448489.1 hypothetical protein [Geomicrobium halophilum]
MNRTVFVSLMIFVFLLSACAPQAEISHIEDESEIVLSSEGDESSVSFNALIANTSERPAEELLLHWEVNDEKLLESLSEPELLQSDEGEPFSIGGGDRYMISETFFLNEPLEPEGLSGSVDAVITNESEEVYRFTFEEVVEA